MFEIIGKVMQIKEKKIMLKAWAPTMMGTMLHRSGAVLKRDEKKKK